MAIAKIAEAKQNERYVKQTLEENKDYKLVKAVNDAINPYKLTKPDGTVVNLTSMESVANYLRLAVEESK